MRQAARLNQLLRARAEPAAPGVAVATAGGTRGSVPAAVAT